MKPCKYSHRHFKRYTEACRWISPAETGARRRILVATPTQHLPALTTDTDERLKARSHTLMFCSRPNRNRRITMFVFSDASVIVHIQRAVKLASGFRCVLFNRFALGREAAHLIAMMLDNPEVQALRASGHRNDDGENLPVIGSEKP